MNYEEFENTILTELKNDDKKCLNTLENNTKTILVYLKDTEKPIHIKEFVNKLNLIIIEKNKFKLIEKVLRHDLFSRVLTEFRSSYVLIKACQNNNVSAASWLLTMDIDKRIQDENGMTALMHAARRNSFNSVVEELVKDNDSSIHFIDNNGETALFHAVNNIDILSTLLNSKIDINHKNKNGETVFIYCCKNELMKAVDKLIIRTNNLNIRDNMDRNAVMYLVKNGKYKLIDHIIRRINSFIFDINYRNKNNETLVSILISQFRELYHSKNFQEECSKVYVYAFTLMSLVKLGCDFNIIIDEEGNTPVMFFLMIGDNCSAYYLLKNCNNIDISIKNKNGVSASYLSLKIKETNYFLRTYFLQYKTFDFYYQDEHRNNPLMYYAVHQNPILFSSACGIVSSSYQEKVYDQVNDKNENALIMAVKLGKGKYITDSIINSSYIDQQDHLGNTAIYYAIELNNKYAINALAYHHANLKIKNNEGISAYDLSKKINDNGINKILNNPISIHDFEKKEKKNNKKLLFFKKKNLEDDVDYRVESNRKCYDYMSEERVYTYPPLQDYEVIKNNLWLIYSNHGALDIMYNKNTFGNRQSLNDANIILKYVDRTMESTSNRSIDLFQKYIDRIKCPF